MDNNIDGEIPNELCNLLALKSLALNSNSLSGSIPPWLGDLQTLEALGLGYNQLTGAIPVSLGNLTNMEMLMLGSNDLSGTIPDALSNAHNLKVVFMGNNRLTGHIPHSFENLILIEQIDFSENDLTGCIPLSFAVIQRGYIRLGVTLPICLAKEERIMIFDSAYQAINQHFINNGMAIPTLNDYAIACFSSTENDGNILNEVYGVMHEYFQLLPAITDIGNWNQYAIHQFCDDITVNAQMES